jgi:hypothetical protein
MSEAFGQYARDQNRHADIELTFGWRRYFRLVLAPVAADAEASACLPLLSGSESSPLRYDASTLVALPSATGSGTSEDFPRVSAMAL